MAQSGFPYFRNQIIIFLLTLTSYTDSTSLSLIVSNPIPKIFNGSITRPNSSSVTASKNGTASFPIDANTARLNNGNVSIAPTYGTNPLSKIFNENTAHLRNSSVGTTSMNGTESFSKFTNDKTTSHKNGYVETGPNKGTESISKILNENTALVNNNGNESKSKNGTESVSKFTNENTTHPRISNVATRHKNGTESVSKITNEKTTLLNNGNTGIAPKNGTEFFPKITNDKTTPLNITRLAMASKNEPEFFGEIESENDEYNENEGIQPVDIYDNIPTFNTSTNETKIIIRMRQQCDPHDSNQECENFPHARCLEHDTSLMHICKCDYLHTVYLDGAKIKCFINVFAPCTYGEKEYSCGENMHCHGDALGIRKGKFCRCLPGYAPVPNRLQIPAFCRPIISQETEEVEEEMQSSACTSKNYFLFSMLNSFSILQLVSLES